jgi:transcriptional regulator
MVKYLHDWGKEYFRPSRIITIVRYVSSICNSRINNRSILSELGLGKPRPHNKKVIRERREQILLLMSRGYSQGDIARELNITRQTISSDMRYINEITNKGLFGLAKETLTTMYFNCMQGVDEVRKEAWRVYRNEDNDPSISNWHRIASLKICIHASETKFTMIGAGPTMMNMERLKNEIAELKNNLLNGKEPRGFRRLPYPSGDTSSTSTSALTDLDNP